MSDMMRFGTGDELYRLTRKRKAVNIPLDQLHPIMTVEMAATHGHSHTRKPILVNRENMMITDGNHRFHEALKAGHKTIPAILTSGKVIEYRDYRTGKIKVRSAD